MRERKREKGRGINQRTAKREIHLAGASRNRYCTSALRSVGGSYARHSDQRLSRTCRGDGEGANSGEVGNER